MQAGEIIYRYGEVARPIMRQFMERQSCIASARVTIEVMRALQLRAEEIPVSLTFKVPARRYIRIAGYTPLERKQLQSQTEQPIRQEPIVGRGWNGHLVVLAENRWLIDPSIDQVHNEELGVEVNQHCLVIDTSGHKWNPHKPFGMHLGLTLDNGDTAELHYQKINKRDYLDSEAWNDEGLPLLASAITEEIFRAAH